MLINAHAQTSLSHSYALNKHKKNGSQRRAISFLIFCHPAFHIPCVLHTQKLAQRHTHATYMHIRLHTCMQYVCNYYVQHTCSCLYTAYMLHAHKLHTFLHMLVWHTYGAEPIFVYAHTCNMDVLCVQHACSIHV